MIKEFLFLILAYLIGTISPSYLFGRLALKKDIRKMGTKNLGATNVFLKVGKTLGVITALLDIFKGFIVVYLAMIFGFNYLIIYASAVMVILGHIFPFYLRFKGGKGMSTAGGAALAALIFGRAIPYFREFFAVLILYILIIAYYRTSIALGIKPYRKILRLLAILIPAVYFISTKQLTLILLAIIGVIFLIADIARLFSKKINKSVFSKIGVVLKKKEKRNISAITWFIIGAFLTILLFQKEIAILSVSLAIFGDSFAEIYGKKIGKTKLIGDKSLEGSIAYLISASLISLILYNYLALKPILFILGPLISALAEAITLKIDDNLAVPIITALILSII